MYLLEDSLVNRLVMPESGEDEPMTVISGRRCSALLTKSGPLGLSVRMLLESPLWWKEGYLLRWEATPLCSRRVTSFTDTNLTSPSPLNESAETLNISDIPSSRCLFRLRVLERPIEETESSSSRTMMLITPTAVQMSDPPDKMKERKERNGYRNGTTYTSLETQVKYDPKFKGILKTPSEFDGYAVSPKKNPVTGDSGSLAQEMMSGYVAKRGFLMPTPLAVDVRHKKRVEELKENGATEIYSRTNGDSRPNGLMDFLQFHELLPTPKTMDGCHTTEAKGEIVNGRRITEKGESFGLSLTDMAHR